MASMRSMTPLMRASRVAARSSFNPQAVRQTGRRGYAQVSPPPPPGKSNVPYFLAALGAAAAGGAYLFFGTDGSAKDTAKEIGTAAKSVEQIAEQKLGLAKGIADYQKVYNKIASILEQDDYDDGSLGPVLIRLAWHSSGTYDKATKTGGSNYATMRFKAEASHGANNGLLTARERMEKVKQEFPWISYGDLWTLGGVVAVQEAQGPIVPWRPGRIDGFEHHVTPDGRLPDASQAQDHLRFIFNRMGFNDQEIVALSGAHAMGRCHTDRSGFDGPWTFSPTTFTNDYFKLLFDEKWNWKKWGGPAQFEDSKTKSLMMLPTDMALVKDKSFKKYAKAYADDADLFFKDFSAVFAKLIELGVPEAQLPKEQWNMKTVDQQSS